MQFTLNDLLGPLGLTVALLAAVAVLARLVIKYIDRIIAALETRIVDLIAQRDVAVAGWREQTTVTRSTTEAVERLSEAVERLSEAVERLAPVHAAARRRP